jgi:hypothetical protein
LQAGGLSLPHGRLKTANKQRYAGVSPIAVINMIDQIDVEWFETEIFTNAGPER